MLRVSWGGLTNSSESFVQVRVFLLCTVLGRYQFRLFGTHMWLRLSCLVALCHVEYVGSCWSDVYLCGYGVFRCVPPRVQIWFVYCVCTCSGSSFVHVLSRWLGCLGRLWGLSEYSYFCRCCIPLGIVYTSGPCPVRVEYFCGLDHSADHGTRECPRKIGYLVK